MPVPYTFEFATGNIPLSHLDVNFANVKAFADTAGFVTENHQANITSLGTLANLTVTNGIDVTAGDIEVDGNVRADFIIANGSTLTALPNALIAAYLPTYTGALTSLTGAVTTTANIGASYFIGNGSFLTGIASYGNSNVSSFLASGDNANRIATTSDFAGASLSVTGLVQAGSLNVDGNATVDNLESSGFVGGNGSRLSNLPGGNVIGAVANAVYATTAGAATSAITAATVTGPAQANITSVGTLSSLAVAGSISAGSVSTTSISAGTITGTLTSNAQPNITSVGTLSSLTVSGGISSATVTGSLTTAAQPNITTVGTLTALSVSGNITGGNLNTTGNITAGNIKTDNYFYANGIPFVSSDYSDANVAAYLPIYGGNITADQITANSVSGVGAGTPTLSSVTNLDLSAGTAVRVIGGGVLRLPSLTAAQIANVIAVNGDIVYNSTVNKFQGYENGAWGNLI